MVDLATALGLAHFSSQSSQDHREVTWTIFPCHSVYGNTKMSKNSYAFRRPHFPVVNSAHGPPQHKKALFTRETTFCEDETPFRYETQNASFSCSSVCLPPRCFASFSNHALPLSRHPHIHPPLSSDAWLRAIEHCLSAFAGFSDFPEVPLIWKLNDSTQCQNS